MTDWMPWAFVFAGGVFATLWYLLQAVDQIRVGAQPDLARARLAFWIGLTLSALVYLLYVVVGEAWLPYA